MSKDIRLGFYNVFYIFNLVLQIRRWETMMLQDKKIDKDDILKYCEITIDVVTGVFHC